MIIIRATVYVLMILLISIAMIVATTDQEVKETHKDF